MSSTKSLFSYLLHFTNADHDLKCAYMDRATKLLRDMWHCDMGFLAAIQARNAMIEDKVLTISRINYLQNQLLEINRENIKRDELLFEIDL